METLVLNGKTYVKASKAARDLGYTSDYVGQLCRGGHVDAHLVGRTWYVNQDQLGEHRVEKKRMSRVKAREQARKSIEEHKKLAVAKTKNGYQNIAIHYEEDDKELIPQLRKLSVDSAPVVSEKVAKQQESSEIDDDEPYTVLNKGEKVIMSGKLKIVDASEDALDRETVVLTPRLERKKHISPQTRARAFEDIAHIDAETVEGPVAARKEETVPIKSDFLSKLDKLEVETYAEAEEEVLLEEGATTQPLNSEDLTEVSGKESKGSILPYSFVIFVLLIATCGSLILESTWTYTRDMETESTSYDTSYGVDVQSTLDKIQQKI